MIKDLLKTCPSELPQFLSKILIGRNHRTEYPILWFISLLSSQMTFLESFKWWFLCVYGIFFLFWKAYKYNKSWNIIKWTTIHINYNTAKFIIIDTITLTYSRNMKWTKDSLIVNWALFLKIILHKLCLLDTNINRRV